MKVYLTRRAEKNYNSIKDYIAEEWGEGTAEEFAQKADKLFQLLEDFPEMGPLKRKIFAGFSFHDKQNSFIESEITKSLFYHSLM